VHVLANRRFRHYLFRPFRPDPLPDPMRRVALLARRLTVAGQDGFYERHQPREHRPAPLGLLPRRRLCIGQGLTHLPPMHSQLPRHSAYASYAEFVFPAYLLE
jgi:hypothetical protein